MHKELCDACMKQAEMFSKRVYNRQTYQWKVTLGLWALIAAATKFLSDKNLAMPYWVVWAIVAGYAFLWVRAIAIRNYDDQRLEWHFIRQTWRSLEQSDHRFQPPPAKTPDWSIQAWFGFLHNWAHLFEVATTAVLLNVAYWLLRNGQCVHK